MLECSQIRYTQMLAVRRDWRIVRGGTVAADLVAQVDGRRLRVEVASRLIAASLDLLVATWPRAVCPAFGMRALSPIAWQVANLYYLYLPPNDDVAMGTCIELARRSELTVILARGHDRLKRRLLTAVLRKRTPNIWTFDTFISWRTTSADIDQSWPPGRALCELLTAYNRRTNASDQPHSLLVDLPGACKSLRDN